MIPDASLRHLLDVDVEGWLAELPLIRAHFSRFGTRLPEGLNREVAVLEERLKKAKK
jgi:phosphoenolpyruvate carboxykinase (GTP)